MATGKNYQQMPDLKQPNSHQLFYFVPKNVAAIFRKLFSFRNFTCLILAKMCTSPANFQTVLNNRDNLNKEN